MKMVGARGKTRRSTLEESQRFLHNLVHSPGDEFALRHAAEAMETVLSIMRDEGAAASTRYLAARDIIDRAYGKPKFAGVSFGGGITPTGFAETVEVKPLVEEKEVKALVDGIPEKSDDAVLAEALEARMDGKDTHGAEMMRRQAARKRIQKYVDAITEEEQRALENS